MEPRAYELKPPGITKVYVYIEKTICSENTFQICSLKQYHSIDPPRTHRKMSIYANIIHLVLPSFSEFQRLSLINAVISCLANMSKWH